MGRTKKFLSSPGVGSFLSSVAAIIIGLLIGYIILLICNYQTATPALGTLLSGSFGLNGFSKTAARICYYAMPMIACGLAITFALKTGSFNIGVCGQYYIGMFVAILSAHLLKDTFGSLVWLPSLILGTLAGGIWALLPAILNAFRNVNIIISGIMMNYIGTYLVSLLIRKIDLIYFSSQAMTKAIPNEAILPKAGLDKLFPAHGAGANLGILICIAIGIIVYLVINRTTFGYELRACGFNRDAAKYAGINEKKSVVLAVFISGLLAGLGGAIYALSSASNNMYISDAIDGTGFTGICVALLGMTNPIGVIFAGFFVSFIKVGGINVQIYGFSSEIVDVIIAAIIYACSVAPLIKMLYMRFINKVLNRDAEADKIPSTLHGKPKSSDSGPESIETNKGGSDK